MIQLGTDPFGENATFLQRYLLGGRWVRGVYLQQKLMDMKKFVFAFAVLVLVGSAFASAQKKSASAQKSDIVKAPGSVTFKVEDVEVAEKILPVTNGFELGRKLAGGPYLDCSFTVFLDGLPGVC